MDQGSTQLVLDTDVSYGHRGVSRLRSERHRKLDVAALGPQVLTFWAGFKELASGEQDFECASVGGIRSRISGPWSAGGIYLRC